MNKVKQIIEEDFDGRVGLSVITYTFCQLGQDKAAEITDEEIENLKGNALMTDRFVQAMVKTARRIARECNFIKDVIPYIVNEYGYLAKGKDGKEEPWYVEEWYDQDIIWALEDNDVEATEENIEIFKEHNEELFDDKSDRNGKISYVVRVMKARGDFNNDSE